MISLRKHFIAAVLFAAISPVQAEDLAKPLSFSNVQPANAFTTDEIGMRFYSFKNVYKDGMLTVSGGLYDDVTGVACDWTLEGAGNPDGSVFTDVRELEHSCKQVPEPDTWKSAKHQNLSRAFDRFEREIGADPTDTSVIEATSGFTASNNAVSNNFRKWKLQSQEVCLRTIGGHVDARQQYHQSFLIDHGCYKLDRQQFFIKSLSMLRPSQPT